jgi:hypothetical protein
LEDRRGRGNLDLVAEARPELPQHGIVRFVRDTAQGVSGKDYTIAGIDCIHDGREDADICLAA